jgi:group I intron endonuclease
MNDISDKYSIYKVTNIINDKIYVGQTRLSIMKRWKTHQQNALAGGNTYFHKSIRKYGCDSFKIELIIDDLSPDQANEYEIKFITELMSDDPNVGYNGTKGGQGCRASRLTREKMSQSMNKECSSVTQQKHAKIITMFNDFLSTREIADVFSNRFKQVEKVIESHRKKNCITCFNDDKTPTTPNFHVELIRPTRSRPKNMGRAIGVGKLGKPLSVEHRLSISLTQRNQTHDEARKTDAITMTMYEKGMSSKMIANHLHLGESLILGIIQKHTNNVCLVCSS